MQLIFDHVTFIQFKICCCVKKIHENRMIFAARCDAYITRPMPSCGVCPSVMFADHVKTNKHIFEIFSPFLFFYTKRGGDITTGTSIPNGGVECRWGRQKRDSGRISGFAACLVLSTVRVANCEKQSRDGRRRASSTQRRPLFAQDDDDEAGHILVCS